jgi:DNA-binding response OmpR family regulator
LSSPGLRVFVVNDEAILSSTLSAILRLNGFAAFSFTDSLRALESALLEPPALLISDLMMPELSGIDLALQIRALSPSCRVFLFAGDQASVDLPRTAHRLDTNLHILPRPVRPSTLLELIRLQGRDN